MEENQFTILLCGPKVSRLEPFFSPFGYQTQTAPAGQQALQLLNTTHFNAVLFELELGDISSQDFVNKVKDINSDPPLLLLDDPNSATDIVTIMAMGVNCFVSTPPNEEHLFLQVKHLCENNILRIEHLQPEATPKSAPVSTISTPIMLQNPTQQNVQEALAHENFTAHNQKTQNNFQVSRSEEGSFAGIPPYKTPIPNDKTLTPEPAQLEKIDISGKEPNIDDQEYETTNIQAEKQAAADSSIELSNEKTNVNIFSEIKTSESDLLSPQKAPQSLSLVDIQDQIDNPFSQEADRLEESEEGTEIVAPIPSLLSESSIIEDFSYEPEYEEISEYEEINDNALPQALKLQSFSEEQIPDEDFSEATVIANIDDYQVFQELNDIQASKTTGPRSANDKSTVHSQSISDSLEKNNEAHNLPTQAVATIKIEPSSEDFDIDFEM